MRIFNKKDTKNKETAKLPMTGKVKRASVITAWRYLPSQWYSALPLPLLQPMTRLP